MKLTLRELETAEKISRLLGSKWSAVEIEDLNSHLCLWMLEHYHKVEQYRVEEGGDGKLWVALRRIAQRYAVAEQQHRSGGLLDDNQSYSLREVMAALPLIFDPSSWPQTTIAQHPLSGAPMASESSSEAGMALVLLSEVSAAYKRLPAGHKQVLAMRFRDDMKLHEIAEFYGISHQAADKRVQRGIKALHMALG